MSKVMSTLSFTPLAIFRQSRCEASALLQSRLLAA